MFIGLFPKDSSLYLVNLSSVKRYRLNIRYRSCFDGSIIFFDKYLINRLLRQTSPIGRSLAVSFKRIVHDSRGTLNGECVTGYIIVGIYIPFRNISTDIPTVYTEVIIE